MYPLIQRHHSLWPPSPRITRNVQFCATRKTSKVVAGLFLVGLSYEQFEPRFLLAATVELSPIQEQVIFDYIASHARNCLLANWVPSDLQFIAADTEAQSTTALFQQTVNGIAVQDAYITVVQQDGLVQEVYDRGFENLCNRRWYQSCRWRF